MTHYTRAQGFTDLPTEATEVARAARDVGVRVGFAVSMKDRNPLVYGPSEPVLAAPPAGGGGAREVGGRVGFAVPMKDRTPLVDGPSEPVLAALPADARQEIA